MARVVVVALPFLRMIVMIVLEVEGGLMRSKTNLKEWKVTNVWCSWEGSKGKHAMKWLLGNYGCNFGLQTWKHYAMDPT